MTRDQLEARLAALKAKLKARDGRAGLSDNVSDIKAQIARLEADLAPLD